MIMTISTLHLINKVMNHLLMDIANPTALWSML